MKILTSQIGEKLHLLDNDTQIHISILDINKRRVRVGVDADANLKVWRTEVYKQTEAEVAQRLESYHYQSELEKPQGMMMNNVEDTRTKPKVLLVEDTDIIRKVNSHFLTSLGCEVNGAPTGREAIELFYQNQYDLTLLDIGLPDISGIDVCKRMQRRAQEHSIPIIFLTALGDDIKEKSLKAGGDDFATKPITMEKLGQLIQKWLPDYQLKSKMTIR